MPGMHRHRIKLSLQRWVQLASAALLNGYAAGFRKGKIFTGKTKAFCVPVLNCYSCPGALGACPIGSLQAALGGVKPTFPFYVLGLLMMFGVVLGRLVCGFLCPFGLVQDLLYKIPLPKWKLPKKIDRPLRYVKYAVLLLLVILLPLLVSLSLGTAPPYFCKYICPAGTLGGGIPLVMANPALRSLAGFLFSWKVLVLAAILIACLFLHRPFCKYLCPLGAFYALFHKFSLHQITLDREKCVNCKQCETACPMDVEITKKLQSPECIHCGKCKAVCPEKAISSRFGPRPLPSAQKDQGKLP